MNHPQRPRVLLLHPILEPGRTVLEDEADVVEYPHPQAVDPAGIARAAQGCAGILSLLKDPITDEVLSVPGLKVVANCAVGFENIDLAAATRHGVLVTNTPGVLDQSTADFAFALIMATARRVVQADHYVRDGNFKGWEMDLMLGRDLYGATLGIIGMGRVGHAVARRASGFLMKLLYHNRQPVHRDVERALHANYVDLDTLLVESDIVSIHVPLTDETHHLIGVRELALMKPTAILVNTSRGAVVDESALIAALKNHKLFGAGLDVFEREPHLPAELLAQHNVILAPHIGSASAVTRSEMSEIAARNVLIGVRGATPANLVNPEALGEIARTGLIALDLDGTIISMQLQVDATDIEALGRARRAGWEVVAATGRPFPGALPWVRRLGLERPFVCYQGAQVRNLDGSVLWEKGLPHSVAMEVVRFCREGGYHVQAYRDDRLIVERDRPEAHAYANHAGMEIVVVADLDSAMGATTPKLVIVADKAEIDQLLPVIRERWRGRLFASTSLPTFLEMTDPEADKRWALEFLAGHLGFSREQVVAVGDGRNDRPMVEWAGLGVAIEGSPAELMEVADRVIAPPGSGGIAGLVDHLLEQPGATAG